MHLTGDDAEEIGRATGDALWAIYHCIGRTVRYLYRMVYTLYSRDVSLPMPAERSRRTVPDNPLVQSGVGEDVC